MIDLTEINQGFDHVALRQRQDTFYLRATFPNKVKGLPPKQYEISLQCKASSKGLKIAIAKAKEIDSLLLLQKWHWKEWDAEVIEQNKPMLIKDAITIFTERYWQKNPKTANKEYNFKVFYGWALGFLPEDEKLTDTIIDKAIKCFPTGSYNRQRFIDAIKPLLREFNLIIDLSKYGKYKSSKSSLPIVEDIISAYNQETNLRHKWFIGVFFTYGLRPHEIFKSEFCFNQEIPIIKVSHDTKTGKRTVYPLAHHDIDYLTLPIPTFQVNLELPNSRLGHQISKVFTKYPFTAYDLRHYYAVRGAMRGISPVTMSKWMGHSLNQHYKSYASLLGEIESEQIWRNLKD